MTKPYQTATPEQRPAHSAPETYTVKRMKAIGLWTLAACLAVAGWWLADVTGWLPVALFAMAVAVALIVAGAFLWEYSNRAIERDLPRGERRIKQTREKQRVVHTHTEATPKADGSGVEFHRETNQADFDYPVEDVARGVEWMLRNGESRDGVTAGLGWGQKPWARIMQSLTVLGVATKQGRSYKLRPERAHDWARSVLGDDIASIIDELDKL